MPGTNALNSCRKKWRKHRQNYYPGGIQLDEPFTPLICRAGKHRLAKKNYKTTPRLVCKHTCFLQVDDKLIVTTAKWVPLPV